MLENVFRPLIPPKYRPRQLTRRIATKQVNGKVMSGPFRELNYINQSVCGQPWPGLLGTYEKELHDQIYRLASSSPSYVINIGAGVGYYAVGIAYMVPQTHVVAFETNPKGRQLIGQLAKINGVQDRVEIEGHCNPQSLLNVLSTYDTTWMLVDIEGYEQHLLDPKLVPLLSKQHIIVEIHDFVDENIGPKIRSRFTKSHFVEEIRQVQRTFSDLPFPINPVQKLLLKGEFLKLMCEGRPEPMRWFIMHPKSS